MILHLILHLRGKRGLAGDWTEFKEKSEQHSLNKFGHPPVVQDFFSISEGGNTTLSFFLLPRATGFHQVHTEAQNRASDCLV